MSGKEKLKLHPSTKQDSLNKTISRSYCSNRCKSQTAAYQKEHISFTSTQLCHLPPRCLDCIEGAKREKAMTRKDKLLSLINNLNVTRC